MRGREAVFVDSGGWVFLDSVLAGAVSALLAAERHRDALVLAGGRPRFRNPTNCAKLANAPPPSPLRGGSSPSAIEPIHPGAAEKASEFCLGIRLMLSDRSNRVYIISVFRVDAPYAGAHQDRRHSHR
jgi:hypothetical protein